MRDESALPAVLRRKLPPNLEKIKNGRCTRSDSDYSINLYLKENDIRVTEEGSDIIQFLRGKNILVTGATGFLGKLLVEKLLRSCKDIGTIYIIVRIKKGKDPQRRVNEYLDNWVFHRLSEIYPNYREKIIGITGDFEQDGLGLTEVSRKLLQEKVNIIYHVAATIRFDEKLKKAVRINIKGTQEMIRLAKECKKLDVFVHVSTAFSNCHEKVINEKFYPPYVDPYHLINVANELPDDVVNKIAPGLLGSVPNTYAFTKQIAEDVVRREAVGFPVCVFRPSIVIASAKEPIRSWVDNIFGPVGLTIGAAMGLLHVMIGNPIGKCDMVPADYVINSCIVLSHKTAKERMLDNVQVFNYTSCDENPLYWKDLGMSSAPARSVGSMGLLMKGYHSFTSSYYWYILLNFLLHTVPAYIADFVAVRLGKKPQLVAAYAKINKFINVLSYFTLNEWSFDNSNTKKAWDSLNEIDKKNFPFDLKTLEWQEYFDTYLVAIREFLMFDFLDTLDEGRKLKLRLDIIHYVAVTTLVVSTTYLFLNTIFCFIPLTLIGIIVFYVIQEY